MGSRPVRSCGLRAILRCGDTVVTQFPFDKHVNVASGGRAAKLNRIRDLVRAWQLPQALAAVEPLLKVDPRDPQLLHLAAVVHLQMARFDQAVALSTRALTVSRTFDTFILRAEALRGLGRTDEALADFEQAAKIAPIHAEVVPSLASTLEQAGRFTEAQRVLDDAMARLKLAPSALPLGWQMEQAKLHMHAGEFAKAIGALDSIRFPQAALGTPPHLNLLFMRAKVFDKAGDYSKAWNAALEAHAASKVRFDPAEMSRVTDRAVEFWTRQRLQELGSSGDADPTAIFIAGMPRSGTSLTDQLIHAHPRGAGVGELNTLEVFSANAEQVLASNPRGVGASQYASTAKDYLRQVRSLAPQADRISNKALGNIRFMPHLAMLFPATRVVHCMRDPRDIAVSVVLGAFNSTRTPWVARPEWVAHAWGESDRLMSHWQGVLDVPFLRFEYEQMVESGEPQFRRLMEFIGLPWDDRVTQFHSSKRTVRTLSYDQVNKPLYSAAAGRWKNYEPQLRDIKWPVYRGQQ